MQTWNTGRVEFNEIAFFKHGNVHSKRNYYENPVTSII